MRGKKLVVQKKRNKKLKRICWSVFLGLLGLILLTYIFMWTASQGLKPGENLVTRTTPHTLVFTGSQVPVELQIVPTSLTSLPPKEGRPLDIIIGLDNSLSMTLSNTERTPLEVIKEIARVFLENTNLERHQVAIARLDDQARVIQGFSQNKEILKNVIDEIPESTSTRIFDGLSAMNIEFNSMRRRPGSVGVAIILSDGRSNPSQTQQEADRLKQQEGVFIAPIGIGEPIDDNVMKSIASWPSEYQKLSGINDPQKIVDAIKPIYLNWIKTLEQLMAVDVHVKEYYNHTALDLIPTSITPTGTLDRNQNPPFIEWTIPFLTTKPVTLRYTQKAPRILWHPLDHTTGSVSFKPIGLPITELPIHRKPKVIVISPLIFFLLLLALAIPLAILAWLWYKERLALRGLAVLPAEIPQPGLFPTPALLPGLQLDKLIRNTDPTLVIGLGGTGRWVLTYLKKAVMETNYGLLPQTAKFLLIDTSAGEIRGDTAKTVQVGGVELTDDELLVLDEGTTAPENLLERTKKLSETPGSEPHFKNWWPAQAFKDLTAEAFYISHGTQKRRPIGRMALFLDLEKGPEYSRFWTQVGSLLKELGEPKKGTKVFIASSLCGGLGSGMFTDTAYLVRHIAQYEKFEGITIHAALALHNTFAPFTDSLGLTIPNTFAGLRELDRFLSCRDFQFPMIYSPEKESKMNGSLQAPLLDNCYVFDADRPRCPLHQDKPEYGVFPSMADTIHTFLYNSPGSAFDQVFAQNRAVSELEREESGHGVVSSLGTFVYRLPMFEFVQVFKYRYAKEMIAYLFGLEKDQKGQWVQFPINVKDRDILDKELESFLSKEGADRSPSDILQVIAARDTEMLLAILEADRAHKDSGNYTNLHKINYTRHLAAYIMNFLDGQYDVAVPERKKRYSAALYFLNRLNERIKEVSNQEFAFGKDAHIAGDLLAAYHEITENTLKDLSTFNDIVLKGKKEDNQTEKIPLPLVQYLETRETEQLENRRIDKSILVREYLYNDDMERQLYDDYLGDKVKNENLSRFVWHCQESNGRMDIRLKLVTDRLDILEPGFSTLRNARTVMSLPELLLQTLWDIDITPYLETARPYPKDVAYNIYEKSTPLIHFEKYNAPRHTSKMFLSLRSSQYLDKLMENLRPNFPSETHVKGTDFRDPHAFSSVFVLDSLPITSIAPYEQSMKKYLALPPHYRQQLHVFAAEQNATVYEEILPEVKEPKHAFHPRFISYLQNLDQIKLFAYCAVHGFLPNLFHYDADSYTLDFSTPTGKSCLFLTQKEPSRRTTPLDALHTFIKGKAKTEIGSDISIPFDSIRDVVKNHSLTKEFLLEKEKEIITMKTDETVKPADKNLLSFIHLILKEELKKFNPEG